MILDFMVIFIIMSQSNNTAEKRLEREREFHDHAFSSDLREGTQKFYALTQIEYDEYEARLRTLLPGADVLEYGCGPYGFIYEAAMTARSASAIDISPVAIQISQEKAKKMKVPAEFFVMNCEQMDFPDDSFDLIFGVSILHHLDLTKTFSEMRRVLRPGGVILFTEPLGHNPFINLYRRLTPRLRTEDEHPFMHSDIEFMEQRFGSLRKDFYHLTTFVAVPFGKTSLFKPLRRTFHFVDQSLFRIFPFLRRQAWMVLLEASPGCLQDPEAKPKA